VKNALKTKERKCSKIVKTCTKNAFKVNFVKNVKKKIYFKIISITQTHFIITGQRLRIPNKIIPLHQNQNPSPNNDD